MGPHLACGKWEGKPIPSAFLALVARPHVTLKAFCLYTQDSVLFLPSDSGDDIITFESLDILNNPF